MTQYTSAIEVRTAVYNKLINDTTLIGEVTGVFDGVPQPTNTPYVTIGDYVERVVDYLSGGRGFDLRLTIHIWSVYMGWKESDTIYNDVMRILHKQSLTLTTLKFVYCSMLTTLAFRDSDGVSRHQVVTFKILTEV